MRFNLNNSSSVFDYDYYADMLYGNYIHDEFIMNILGSVLFDD